MIPLLLSLQFVAAAPETSVWYESVPAEVVRVQLFAWPAARLMPQAGRHGTHGRVSLRGTPGRLYVATFARPDGAYLLDGPFAWPAEDGTRTLSDAWHRTVRGDVPQTVGAEAGIEWIRADTQPGPWPICVRDHQSRWSCWGVLPENRGVLVLRGTGSLFWTVTGPAGVTGLRRAQWGRLLSVTSEEADGGNVRVTFGHPVPPPAARLRGIRLETASVAGTRAVPVAPGAVWIAGNDIPARAWMEVQSQTAGPVYLALAEVAEGLASVPLHVALGRRRATEGQVFGPAGAPAPGTLLTAFRLIDPSPGDRERVQARRVFAGEAIAGSGGRFAIDGLGDAQYELVAWHSQFGRASLPVPADGSTLAVHLRAAGLVSGRVLVRGRPAEGVDVFSVPDPTGFSAAQDMTDVKGGDARTGPDGRFVVVIAPSGGGELRIGGGAAGVTRVPLPRPRWPRSISGMSSSGRRSR